MKQQDPSFLRPDFHQEIYTSEIAQIHQERVEPELWCVMGVTHKLDKVPIKAHNQARICVHYHTLCHVKVELQKMSHGVPALLAMYFMAKVYQQLHLTIQ